MYDEFIQEGGIENEKLERIFFYLEHEGLIYFYALGGDFYITDKGKEVIEKIDSTEFFKFLIIKAKYNVIEPYYMEGTTPDQLAQNVIESYCLKLNSTDDIYYLDYYEMI